MDIKKIQESKLPKIQNVARTMNAAQLSSLKLLAATWIIDTFRWKDTGWYHCRRCWLWPGAWSAFPSSRCCTLAEEEEGPSCTKLGATVSPAAMTSMVGKRNQEDEENLNHQRSKIRSLKILAQKLLEVWVEKKQRVEKSNKEKGREYEFQRTKNNCFAYSMYPKNKKQKKKNRKGRNGAYWIEGGDCEGEVRGIGWWCQLPSRQR